MEHCVNDRTNHSKARGPHTKRIVTTFNLARSWVIQECLTGERVRQIIVGKSDVFNMYNPKVL